jgi:flagellar biosynthesis/type III secretory pathway protein FliH
MSALNQLLQNFVEGYEQGLQEGYHEGYQEEHSNIIYKLVKGAVKLGMDVPTIAATFEFDLADVQAA